MSAPIASLSPPQAFDCEIQGGSTNYSRWQTWMRRFNIYLKASGVVKEEMQINVFLHVAGEQVEEIYHALSPTASEKKLDDVVQLITDHFAPQKNTDEMKLKFRQMVQKQGEGIEAYVVRLKTQAALCEFADANVLKEELKLQLINGMVSKKLKSKALQDGLDVDGIVKTAKANEYSGISAVTDNIKREIKQEANRVSQSHKKPYGNGNGNGYVSQLKQVNYKNECRNCGREWPHINGPCPAQKAKCNNCNIEGHFARKCKKMKQSQLNKKSQYSHNKTQNNKARQIRSEKQARETSSEGEVEKVANQDDSFSQYHIVNKKAECPRIIVKFCKTRVNMCIDTGASINAINLNTFNQLIRKPKLEKDNSKTYSYDNKSPMKSYGKFYTNIKVNGNSYYTEIYVFEGVNDNLLCFDSSVKLKLINMTCRTDKEINDYQKDIMDKYPQLFSGKIGCLKDCEVKLHIDKNVKPIIEPARRIPFYLRDKVIKELDDWEEAGLIEDSDGPTPWVSELVVIPKPSNPEEVRLVIDSRAVNKAIESERHNTPTIEDIAIELNGAKVISKLDLKGGYHQIKITKDSRYITTFRTPKGLKRNTRLTQGIKSAGQKFQHVIEKALNGLDGVRNIADDILVYGSNYEEHDVRLIALLNRLVEKGLTLNPNKCEIRKTSLEFFGLQFSENGISITDSKIKALKEAKHPNNVSEMRSFLGLASYCSRAIPKFAEKSSELWKIARQKKSSKWEWTDIHERQFQDVKDSILNCAMGYFNKEWKTVLEVDASPVGAAAILYQYNPDDVDERKIITFWSQLFNDTESRYSQVEKEAYAIVLACERFELYLIGREFELLTDNKAVEFILRNPLSKPPGRIKRWNMRIREFEYIVQHKPGSDNMADYLSRNPVNDGNVSRQSHLAEQYVKFLQHYMIPRAISEDELIRETQKDETLQKVINGLNSVIPIEIDTKPYLNVIDELSVTNSGILLRGCRVVMPKRLQIRSVQLAHEGHQGVVKTKSLVRERLWFPGIDSIVEQLIDECSICQLNNAGNRSSPLKVTEFPNKAWEELAIDFHGPLPNGIELMVLIDYHSRFPIVEEIKSTSSIYVLPKLEAIFSLMGIPKSIRSDNGPPFMGVEFKQFCENFGVKHVKITPLWPQANGLCENFMKNINKIIKNANNGHKDWRSELQAFLRSYRCTPHSATKVTPSSLMFINSNQSKLPAVVEVDSKHQELTEKAKSSDKLSKINMKAYADKNRKACESELKVGDIVLLKNNINKRMHNKYDNKFESIKYTIKNIKGPMITIIDENGKEKTRNISLIKKATASVVTQLIDNDIYVPLNLRSNPSIVSKEVENRDASVPERNQDVNTTRSRPLRIRRPPAAFADFVVDVPNSLK